MFRLFSSRLFAVCIILAGIMLMASGKRSAAKYAALNDHGQEAEATVIKLTWRERKSTHDDSLYTAHISFTTPEGREVRTEVGVPSEQGRAMRSQPSARTLTVRYLPEDPMTLVDVNKEDPSDAEKAIGRYMLIGGALLLLMRTLLARRGD